MSENSTHIGINAFVRNAIRLPDDEFEKAMRLNNNDKYIDNVIKNEKATAWTKDEIEAYGKL